MTRSVPAVVLSLISLAWIPAQAQESKWNLAPGILRTIPSDPRNEETFTGPLTLPLASKDWTPFSVPKTETLAEMSKKVILRRPVWNLEFSFKPLRMTYVDVPVRGGTDRRLIWYMVYRLRYLGGDIMAAPTENSFGGKTFPAVQKVSTGPQRFFPHFVLRESNELNKSYLDRVIPAAKPVIFQREFSPNRTENVTGKLYDSIEISSVGIELSTPNESKPVWGLVTWDNVDPRTDYFSIYIQGLSNGFRIEVDDQGKAGKMSHKTLKLNFWRPGDSLDETEEEIRFGIPVLPDQDRQIEMTRRYGQDTRVDYLWLYQ